MKICCRGYLGNNHSWSVVSQNLSRAFIKIGHHVDLFSTNGIGYFPDDLKNNLLGYGENLKIISGELPGNNYDMCFSYTAMKNFGHYLSHSKNNRFGIWCFEFAGKNSMPDGFAKYHQFSDKILSPSQFSKQVFIDSGVPASKIEIINHGVNYDEINLAIPFKLKTTKNNKILINLGQLHRRKNITGMLEIFGKAFNKNDDVCLILKIQDKHPQQSFEISFTDEFNRFNNKFPNHAEVEIIREYIPNIYSLYKSSDIIFSASHCEGFGMTHLEGMACGLIPVASNYGGFLDFLNDNNSLLISGKEFKVPPNFLYYRSKFGTFAFQPNIDDAVEKLRYAVNKKVDLKEKFQTHYSAVKDNYSWLEIAKKILRLT